MAKYGSAQFSVFLIGGYSLLAAKVKNVSRKVENILEPSHGLGDGWEESTPTGLGRAQLTQDGAFFDDGTNNIHAALKTAPNTARVGVVANAENLLGRAFTGFLGVIAMGYEVLGQLAGLTKANATYGVSGQVDEGVILQPHAALTANTTGTNVDNTASSANGGVGYLEVSAYSGFTNVVAKIQHSADNSIWADLITFATVTAAPIAERLTVAGSVNRHTRSVVTVTGSGSVTPFIGFARN